MSHGAARETARHGVVPQGEELLLDVVAVFEPPSELPNECQQREQAANVAKFAQFFGRLGVPNGDIGERYERFLSGGRAKFLYPKYYPSSYAAVNDWLQSTLDASHQKTPHFCGVRGLVWIFLDGDVVPRRRFAQKGDPAVSAQGIPIPKSQFSNSNNNNIRAWVV